MVDFGKSPKLFSIIYGEGVFNDIVSIILFGVVQTKKKMEHHKMLNGLSDIHRGVSTEPVSITILDWEKFLDYLRKKCDVIS